MNDSTSTPYIYDFDDYRDYLYHCYQQKKENSPVFTYEYCARKLDVTKSYLQLVFGKKRHTSLDKIWKVAELIEVPRESLKYLVFLFLLNTTEEQQIKSYLMEVLGNLKDILEYRHRTSNDFPVSSTQNKIVSHSWLHMAIYNIIKLDHFKNDALWICEELGLKEQMQAKVQDVIADLITHKMISDQNGELSILRPYDENPSSYDSSEYNDYRGIIERALHVIKDVDPYRPYVFQGRGLPISIENSAKVLDMYQSLYKKIQEIESEEQKREIVVFISNSVYTVTVVK
jgi:uncharacterized protein (TIGR02147 family)